jgi:hypothetical protein
MRVDLPPELASIDQHTARAPVVLAEDIALHVAQLTDCHYVIVISQGDVQQCRAAAAVSQNV